MRIGETHNTTSADQHLSTGTGDSADVAVRGANRARRVTLRLAFAAVVAAAVAGLLYVLTVGTRAGQLVGELILGGRPASADTVTAAEQVLHALSVWSLVIGTLVVITIALMQRRRRLAAVAAGAIIGANLTTQVLKLLVLDRTDLLNGLFYPLPNSFPSGHATAAASLAVGLLLVLPPLLRAPSVILSAIVVAIVGISTLITGWHRMADAVGGVYVATAWGAGLAALLAWRRGLEDVGRHTEQLGRLSSIIPVTIGSGILVLGGLAYVLAAADPLEVLTYLAQRGGSPALFVVGLLITFGASLLSLGALGFMLRDIRLDPRTKSVAVSAGEIQAERPPSA
jgi:membrane-associated phospholipid phosphatase